MDKLPLDGEGKEFATKTIKDWTESDDTIRKDLDALGSRLSDMDLKCQELRASDDSSAHDLKACIIERDILLSELDEQVQQMVSDTAWTIGTDLMSQLGAVDPTFEKALPIAAFHFLRASTLRSTVDRVMQKTVLLSEQASFTWEDLQETSRPPSAGIR